MLFLARFVLQGPSQAALLASAMAILALVPIVGAFTSIISGATVALVTLVHGHRPSIRLMLYAIIACAVFAMLIFGAPWLAVYIALLVWLPVWLIAMVLRQTRSLALSLQLLAVLSLLVIVLLNVMSPQLNALWEQSLTLLVERITEQADGQLDGARLEQSKALLIRMMPGLFAGSLLIGSLLSLLLARWWQAMLYHPGGFGEEYRRLDLGKVSALCALVLMLIALMLRTDMMLAMMVVVVTLYLVQATSVLHAVFNQRKLNAVWLYLVYVLVFILPQLVLLLVLIGLADTWFDFRRRLAA